MGKKTKAEDLDFSQALFVGIDMGTSRSAIAASNGYREVIPSYVGYPKDTISEELLGAEPLFGDASLKHRLSVNLIRPLAHGVIQEDEGGNKKENLEAAQQLVRHLLRRIQSDPQQSVFGVIGAPARASIISKKTLIEAAKGLLDAVMITSEPFAVAYGLGILDRALVIDLGAGTIDLCRLHGTLPSKEDQITLDKAGDHIDETLSTLIKDRFPEAQFTINMIKWIKERYGFVSDTSEQAIATFPVKGRPTKFDITEELHEACRSIIPGIVDAISDLIASYDPEFQEVIRSNIILAGGGSQLIGLPHLIEESMAELGGGKVVRVDEPVYAGANGALKMSKKMPKDFWEVLL